MVDTLTGGAWRDTAFGRKPVARRLPDHRGAGQQPLSPLAQALFAPRGIALIGASADIKKNTARPQRYLRRHGYTGKIVPVNPGRNVVFGERAYPTVAEAPVAVEHAFVMVPADKVLGALEDCARKEIPLVTVFSDGFAEAGAAGEAMQHVLAERAKELGIRLLGPNCIGVISVADKVALSVNAVLDMDKLEEGTLSLVSQSGSMLGALLSRGLARGVGFARLVSVGNEADLSVGEIVDMLVDDPATQSIALFIETIRDRERFARAARRAFDAGKPVVAYKLGRSEVGRTLASSHTGALAGSDAAADAFLHAHGVLRVDMMETLLEIGPMLSGARPIDPPPGHRPSVAVVSTTGGGAAMVADRLGAAGVRLAVPDAALIDTLAPVVAVRAAPVIDLTLTSTREKYAAVLDALADWPGCDFRLAVAGSSAQFHPQLAVSPMVEADRSRKPLAAFLAPAADASLGVLQRAGVPAFRTPEACADAIAAFLRWRAPVPPYPDPRLDEGPAAATADAKADSKAGPQAAAHADSQAGPATGPVHVHGDPQDSATAATPPGASADPAAGASARPAAGASADPPAAATVGTPGPVVPSSAAGISPPEGDAAAGTVASADVPAASTPAAAGDVQSAAAAPSVPPSSPAAPPTPGAGLFDADDDPDDEPAPPSADSLTVRLEKAAALLTALAASDARPNELHALDLFRVLGVPVVDCEVIPNAATPPRTPFPLVAKLLSPDLPHKSELGAVTVGVRTRIQLREAAARMLGRVARARPAARIEGLLLQPVMDRQLEMLVGYRVDPSVGPIIIVGAGGVRAELDRDVAIRLAPLTRPQAVQMLDDLRCRPLLDGWRGAPAADVDALVDTLVAVSQLALLEGSPIVEAEINPLFVRGRGDGAVAVDGLLLLEPK